MDLSRLSQNQRLALSGAIVVVLAGLLSNWNTPPLYLSIVAAIGAGVMVVLPLLMPNTSLPGSRGSLLAVLGLVALGGTAVDLLRYLLYTFETLGRFSTLMFLMALAGSAVMAWAGWQELQGEGGRWVFGWRSSSATGAAAAPSESDAAVPGDGDGD